MNFYNRSMAFFSRHVMLNSIAHAAGGFGLAVVLQDYLRANSFAPLWIGWTLIGFSVIIHLWSISGK